MMQEVCFEIRENAALSDRVFRLRLAGDTSAVRGPGQFVTVSLPGFFLRRPFSVCDCSDGELTLVYQLAGRGTEALSRMQSGRLDILTGLGNGFDLSRAGGSPLLIGGGLGLTPLYYLAKTLPVPPRVLLGFGSEKDAVYLDEFRALGTSVTVCTADGSLGEKGLVTDLLPRFDCSFFYACGPLPMAKALCRKAAGPGQISLEARMGCGFGACMGCTIETVSGPRRVCKDGPVFEKEALVWPTHT